MTTTPHIPFSVRARGAHGQVDADFPATARIGLFYLLADLVERKHVASWIILAHELHRIGRLDLVVHNTNEQAKTDASSALQTLPWQKVYDFCERLYSQLANHRGYYQDSIGNYVERISHTDSQKYIAAELQRLFLEEGLAYEFSNGTVCRRGRKHTVELVSKSQVVLGAPELVSARQHFEKALHFFHHATKPDFENAVKEAVCAVEAAGKTLFPMAKASTLGELIKWFRSTDAIPMPSVLAQTFNGIYAFRNAGEGVAHGGSTGGKASAETTEYVLAVCASQIIYMVDLANGLNSEIPF